MPVSMIAYCGPAAVPDDLWTRWNLDPLLIAMLAAWRSWLVAVAASDARAGWAAIVLMLVIFVSPLCALSSALFSARVLHHVLLIAAVAPLLALAFPLRRAGSPPLARACRGTCGHPLALAHAGTLCMGPRQRACLLADADFAAWKRLAVVAGDPGAGAARPGAGCARRDDWTDGPSRCVDRLRAQAALSGASRKHGELGDSHRSLTSNLPAC